MKRDTELCRMILLDIEGSERGVASMPLQQKARSDFTIGYHCWLLHDAGLIHGKDAYQPGEIRNNRTPPRMIPVHLTASGHDFIEACRDDTTWTVVKERAAVAGRALGTLTFDLIKALAVDVAKKQLGLLD